MSAEENSGDPPSRFLDLQDPSAQTAGVKLHLTPGWQGAVLTAALVVMSCWAISVPGDYFVWFMACEIFWLLLGFIWFVRLLVALAVARKEVRWRNWLIQPALAIFLVALGVTGAPKWTAYYLSRGAMNKQAQAVLNGKDPGKIGRIGLYRVSWAEKQGGVFRFTIDGAGFIDSVGFAYVPGTISANDGEYEHWNGHWYIWTRRF